MKNVPKPLAKSILIPLGLTAAASATDGAIHEKMFGSGTTLIVSNKEMNDMKIIESLEESVFLIKGISETTPKEQKGGFLRILWGTLGAMNR